MMSNYQPVLSTAVVALAISLATSCARSDGASIAQAMSQIPTTAVVKAVRADLSSDLILTAEFDPFQEVDVMAKVSGYIRQIKVDIGDRVHEGQLLATLEIPEMQDELTHAAAAVDEANAELVTARDELRRAESARDIAHLSYSRILDVSKREAGLVPQQEVDEAHSHDLAADAQFSAAQSRIAVSQQRIRVAQADQERLKTLSQYAVITAPFDGVVTKRYANTGALIQAGTASQTQAMPVVRLSQNSLLRLSLPVPESVVPLIKLGNQVDVKVPALNRTFPGKVARFADKVDQSTRTMKTELDVSNPNLTLVPGMYAEVDLTTDQHKNVLSVPVEAVDGSGDSARVFAVAPSDTIRIVPVHLGLQTAERIEIRSDQLEEGDDVVVGPRATLKEGMRVEPKLISLTTSSAPKP